MDDDIFGSLDEVFMSKEQIEWEEIKKELREALIKARDKIDKLLEKTK